MLKKNTIKSCLPIEVIALKRFMSDLRKNAKDERDKQKILEFFEAHPNLWNVFLQNEKRCA